MYFDSLAIEVIKMVGNRMGAIASHLSCRKRSVNLLIKIQEENKPATVELIFSEKSKIEVNKDTLYSLPPKRSSFDNLRFTQEITEAIENFVTKSRFYNLPIEISFILKSDNIICGHIISNFSFKNKSLPSKTEAVKFE